VVMDTHVGVEKTQDELEVRLLAGYERHAGWLALGVGLSGVHDEKPIQCSEAEFCVVAHPVRLGLACWKVRGVGVSLCIDASCTTTSSVLHLLHTYMYM
jgi:hypothetical protein